MKCPSVERQVARVLWSFSRADGGAVAIMRDLSQNPLLTPDERRRADELRREETHHADISARWAQALGRTKRAGYDAYSAFALRHTMVIRRVADPLLRTAWTLAGLRWNEEQSTRAFPRWIRLFERMGRPEMVRDFQAVTKEEEGHVAFGLAVARRLDRLPGFGDAYDHYYRLTAHAGGAILQAAFSGPLQRAEAAFADDDDSLRGAPHALTELTMD